MICCPVLRRAILEVVQRRRLLPFFDSAYQVRSMVEVLGVEKGW